MLFAYKPNDGVYYCGKINRELCFRFPEVSHPLNTTLADFFQNSSGFFRYYASVLYTNYPISPYQIITLERFPELEDLALQVDKFKDMERGGVESETE